jgi:hypothetical protein
MTTQISDYINVKERAVELGCNAPTGLAIIPRNFEVARSKDELVHESSTATIRVLWRQAGISETRIEMGDDRFPCVQEKAFEGWIGPIIFVGASLLSQNPYLMSVAFGVISNYLTDWFKGLPGDKNVKLDIVIEETKGKSCKRIHYEGNAEGLHDLNKIVSEVSGHE